jgi:hypothetical protein
VYLEALQLVGDDGRAVTAGKGAGHRAGTLFDRPVLEGPRDHAAQLLGGALPADPHAGVRDEDAGGVIQLVTTIGNADERNAIGEGGVDRLPARVGDDERRVGRCR